MAVSIVIIVAINAGIYMAARARALPRKWLHPTPILVGALYLAAAALLVGQLLPITSLQSQ